ncbi:hypothetical protein [Catenuloplanes atrovinosus]|uniref:Lipoprotein n=1 Tax=Catenuloplanes atrovinosus TaxID=137266 RepID=A0AAE3YR62_9ACTN|nr:hypothetical protein [Catenuloplanes atrovinosus]MDR7277180.1 hypothetical protein [Catenuloplanes atrovinosus]
MSVKRIVVALAVVMSVAACGTASQPESGSTAPDVVTLRTGTPVASASPTPAGRPIIRPDATSEDIEELEQAFPACMEQNGVPQVRQPDGRYAVKQGGGPPVDEAVRKAAEEACRNTIPESWLDVERRTNPEFADLLRDAAECLKGKGYNARVVQDPDWRISYDSTEEFMAAGDDEIVCTNEAFAERIKTYR